MCGLVGVAGQMHKAQQDSFWDLIRLDTVRGAHSTGVAAVSRGDGVGLFKNTEPGWTFADDPRAQRKIDFSTKVAIGHNRYATKGAVNSRNAHPFMHGNIVGAHNGTLINHRELPDDKEFEVDSESLIYHVDKLGIKDTIEMLRGAWAFVWFNLENNTINFLRNEERPLFYVFGEDRKTLYWASEPWMLHGAVNRRDIKTDDKIKALSPEIHTSWEVPNANAAFGEPFRERIKGATYIPPAVTTYAGNYGAASSYWENQRRQPTNYLGSAQPQLPHVIGNPIVGIPAQQERTEAVGEAAKAGGSQGGESPKGGNVVPINGQTLLGFGGKHITKEELDLLTWDGCTFCSDHLFDNEKPMWLNHDEWLCPKCATGNFHNHTITPKSDDLNDSVDDLPWSVDRKIG